MSNIEIFLECLSEWLLKWLFFIVNILIFIVISFIFVSCGVGLSWLISLFVSVEPPILGLISMLIWIYPFFSIMDFFIRTSFDLYIDWFVGRPY